MLALRTTMRCNTALNTISRNTFKSIKLIQIENNLTPAVASAGILCRNFSSIQVNQKSTLLNGYPSQKRTFASKANEDVDVKDLERIYYGTLTPRMRAVKVFSLTTSLAGLAAQPILMEQGMKLGGTGMAIFLCGFGGFFTFVTPLLLHFVTKKYVTEIHYNPATEEYIATTINIILQKVTSFKMFVSATALYFVLGIMCLQLGLYVFLCLPETKSLTLYECLLKFRGVSLSK